MTRTIMTHRTLQKAFLRVFAGTVLVLALLSGAPAPAAALSVCATHTEVVKQLDARHAEAPVAMGMAANGGIVEVFSTGDGSTWTMVITMPDGVTCLIAAGEAWENLSRMVAGPQA